jgi:hypothetical protein
MRIRNKKEKIYEIIQNKKGYPGARRYKEKTAGKKSKRKDCRKIKRMVTLLYKLMKQKQFW